MNAALPKEGFAFVHLMEGLLLVLLITRPSRAVINLNVCCEKRAPCTESVYRVRRHIVILSSLYNQNFIDSCREKVLLKIMEVVKLY